MTASLTNFLSRAGTPKHIEEAHLAQAYVKADRELGEARIQLISHLGADEVDGKIIPVFDDEVAEVLGPLSAAQKNAATVKQNIRKYLTALGEYDSLQAMTERLLRLKRTADNLDRDVANLSKQAVTRGIERPQDDAAVTNAAVKRDRVAAESRDEIADLEKRIAKAKEIL